MVELKMVKGEERAVSLGEDVSLFSLGMNFAEASETY